MPETCICHAGAERHCRNPVCPRDPMQRRELPRCVDKAARGALPAFQQVPAGLDDLRRTVLRGVTSVHLLRAANGCRQAAMMNRSRISGGRAKPEWIPTMEDQVIDLALMEGVLRTMAGALREAERRDAATAGEAPHAA